MGSRYSEGFIEQALIKVYSRGGRTLTIYEIILLTDFFLIQLCT